MRLVVSPRARRDLIDIGDHIAADAPGRAAAFIAEIEVRCHDIAQFPLAAPARPELGSGVRVMPFRRYLLVYTLRGDEVRIERVLHGARNITDLFP